MSAVLVAASPARRGDVDRAVSWALAHGGGQVEQHRSDHGLAALVHDGGRAHGVVSGPAGHVLWLGITPPAGHDPEHAPPGTVQVTIGARGAGAAAGPGNQRLFAHSNADGLVVSSSVAALVAAIGESASLDRSHEDFLLGFGFLPDNRTPFAGVHALPRPVAVDLSDGATRPVTQAPPSSAAPSPTTDLADLLVEIVDSQAGGAREVGVLLGGFDSALVAAALHRTGRSVHTFTFSFDEPGFGQRNVEAAVTAAGAEHHWVRFDPDRMADALWRLPERINQPSPQPHYQLQTIIAAEDARAAGVDMVFTGDGCDALFAAYPTINKRAAAGGVLGRVPHPVRTAMLRVLAAGPVEHRLGHVARVGRSALRASELPHPASRHLPTQYLDEVALQRLRRGSSPTQAEAVAELRVRLAEESGLDDPARLAVDGNARTGQSQSKVEGAVARSGLAVVSPFTDERFRAAIAALPTEQQRPDGRLFAAEGKPVLQHAAERAGLLPHEVIYQAKQSPTEAPIDDWYAGPMRSSMGELLAHLPFETDQRYVDAILRPKHAESVYRQRLAISQHAFQAIGLLASYASFTRLAR